MKSLKKEINVLIEEKEPNYFKETYVFNLKGKLHNPKTGTILTLMILLGICLVIISVFFLFNIPVRQIEYNVWQTYVNTVLTAHGGILAISITLFVFMIQSAGTTKREKVLILKEFTNDNFLFPTIYWGLYGFLLWLIITTFATTPPIVDSYMYQFLAALIVVALLNTISTVVLIVILYSKVLLPYNDEWLSNTQTRLLEKEGIKAFYYFLSQELGNHTLRKFEQENSNFSRVKPKETVEKLFSKKMGK
ncbi:hypothetical protein ACTWQB_14500 [Piscibacillus sp. B03]|uniref:hypothetical protein n=1 Tax=Piscibacillus sp. B03 TaxID=3457430 RepID=UPI003FCD9447